MILYTSGTTGRPKGAMLAHCNIIHSAMVYESCLKLTAADRSIAAVPLGHVTGVVANIMTMVRCAGALIIMVEFKAAEYLKMAARERVTYTVMVPAMYNLCLLQPDFDSYDLSSWRIGGFGGAPMPIATIEKLDAKIPGLKLANCYGATETTSPSTMMPRRTDRQPHRQCRPAVSGRADRGDGCRRPRSAARRDRRDLDPRRLGHQGLLEQPEGDGESFTGGFWHSGDLGSIDAENFVRVFDRQKDMINRGGFKIYSAEVESVLAGHPGVVESAIIAKPCPVLGERVHAVMVTRDGASAPRRCAPGAPSGCRTTRCRRRWTSRRAAAAQRQRQGDEAPAARGLGGGAIVACTALEFRRAGLRHGFRSFCSAARASRVDRGRADDALEIQQRELRVADPVRRRARRQLDAERAVAIGALGLAQHGVKFLFPGLRALHDGHATAADSVAVELDGGSRIERLVDRFERASLPCTCAPTDMIEPLR